ncbi:MAG: M48 family metallopeptidase [Sphingomonadaceae bacterium]
MSVSPAAAAPSLVVRRSKRARRLRLSLDPRSGAVRLPVPPGVGEARARAWAAGQREWIEAQRAALAPPAPIRPGMKVPLEGLPVPLDWTAGRPPGIRLDDGRIIAGGPVEGLPAALVGWLKGLARERLEAESRAFASVAGLCLGRVSVGDAATRWGSCSPAGDLRYSWRLILAPAFVRRATVAHEVAHLAHMNHGPRFHALVAGLLGEDPAPARLWLRREGGSLLRFGRED